MTSETTETRRLQPHARAVIVGGGCVGAGILYGLAKRGWTDVALLERTQLTAGSTWHAAGLIPSYSRSINVARMVAKTIEIYEGLEAETGQNVGWHKCGQLRIANSRDRLDEFKSYMSVADVQGLGARLISPAEARELWPLLENKDMLGALYHPHDGRDGQLCPADRSDARARHPGDPDPAPVLDNGSGAGGHGTKTPGPARDADSPRRGL
jgi:dimethylglycine dehydrogenase